MTDAPWHFGLDLDSFACAKARAEAIHKGGLIPVDRYGRERIGLSNGGEYGELMSAIHHVRRPEPLRHTRALRSTAFWRSYYAVALANLKGCTLNAFLAVSWGSVGLHGAAAWAAHQKFMDLLSSRMRSWGNEPAWVWVREVGSKLGDHTHLLLHLSPHVSGDLVKWATRAVRTVSGRDPVQGANGVFTVDLRRRRIGEVIGQWARFRYMFKGIGKDEERGESARSRHSVPLAERAELSL